MGNIFNIILIQPLANGLILFYKLLFNNMGLAIIGFAIAIRFLLQPLTKPYMESMKKLKDLQPQLDKLKEKYKNDKSKLVQAQADFYKENKVNPGGGCLPYLLQIVILIALFNVFTKVLSASPDSVNNFNQLLYPFLKFQSGEIINTHFLYLELSKPDVFHIPGLPFPIPGPILLLAAILQFLSAKITMPYVKIEEKMVKKTKSSTDDMQVAMQQSMIYTFPLFTIIFGLNFPSGLAIYWLLFSLWQLIQQYATSGWGGLTPWISRLGLLKSDSQKK